MRITRGDLPACHVLPSARGDEEELAEVSRGHSKFNDRTEGLNLKLGLETQISMTIGDAESRAAMLETHPEGSRRNRREEGLGALKVTATRVSLVR